jgi:hypothetical protein
MASKSHGLRRGLHSFAASRLFAPALPHRRLFRMAGYSACPLFRWLGTPFAAAPARLLRRGSAWGAGLARFSQECCTAVIPSENWFPGTNSAESRLWCGFWRTLIPRLHLLENRCTYKGVFFVDSKNRRSTTGSFFDSFLSFSGWCGVRGSSEVTFLIARLGRRASKGL